MNRHNSINLSPARRRMALALIVAIASMGLPARLAAEQPRLVLSIVIDGLDGEYLDMLASEFGEGGFKRLMREGLMLANADYGTNLDPVAASAMLMTGAAPDVNGIGRAMTYDRESMRLTPALHDPESLGNFTSATYSPRHLAVGTLTDEVRIAGGGLTQAYSVAPDPQQAIVLAGHAANAALWIEDINGNWASTAWYKDMPPAIAKRNRSMPLTIRLDTVSWAPLLPTDRYPGLPDHLRRYPFRYVFPKGNPARYDIYKASASVNTEVTDVAGELIAAQELGRGEGTDMLALAYTLTPFDYTRATDTRLELMDKYVRLDRELERIIDTAADAAGGRDRLAILVAGTPRTPRSRRDDERWGIPGSEFSTRKALSLLNMYLIASYGNGEWFNAYHDGTFYLNRRLVKERQVDAAALRASAAEFLGRMSGVHRVYTYDDVIHGRAGQALLHSMPPTQLGDLIVSVTPGWEIVDDFNHTAAATPAPDAPHFAERYAPATAPVFILAPEVEAARIDTPVDVRTIAPTMARLLRIRSPNAAEMSPLR